MKSTLLTLSLFIIAWTLGGCSNQALKQYVTPSYKTVSKSVEVTALTDARTNQDDRRDLPLVTPVKAVELRNLKESQLFTNVYNTDMATGQQDVTLDGKVTDYGIDYSMTTWTWMPDVIGAGIFAGLGIGLGYPPLIGVGLIVYGLDFLIDGLAGKRQYEHDYKLGLALQLKDKSGTAIWQDTLHYTYSLIFTHWSLMGNTNSYGQSTGIQITDVAGINNAALEVVTDEAIEQALNEMAPAIGSQRLSLTDPPDSFDRTLDLPFGKLKITGKRIHS